MANVVVLNNYLTLRRAQYALGGAPTVLTPTLALFTNNVVPSCTDTTGTYTQPSGGSGYGTVSLVYANWVFSLASCVYTVTYPSITFTFTSGSFTIYGHFVYDSTGGGVLYSYQWPTAYSVPGGGGAVSLTPQWVDLQC